MKKLIKIFKYFLIIPLFLTSCRTSPNAAQISFLDEQKASFYYFGKESTLFSRLKYYSDIVPSEFPDIETNPIDTDYIAFGIDVKNKEDEITITLLNQIYDYLESEKYVFVYFMNYDDLSVLRRSKFKEYSDVTAGSGLSFYVLQACNYYMSSRTIKFMQRTYSYMTEEDRNDEYLHEYIILSYYNDVLKILTDQ